MKTITRIALASAALTAGLALTGGSQAQAGIAIDSALNASHARVSVHIGHPSFRVGAYVPQGYRVSFRPSYGYGFTYRDCWIPVRRYQTTWRVCDRPYVTDNQYDRYDQYDRSDRYDNRGYGDRDDRQYRDRRQNRRYDDRDRHDDRYDRDDDCND